MCNSDLLLLLLLLLLLSFAGMGYYTDRFARAGAATGVAAGDEGLHALKKRKTADSVTPTQVDALTDSNRKTAAAAAEGAEAEAVAEGLSEAALTALLLELETAITANSVLRASGQSAGTCA